MKKYINTTDENKKIKVEVSYNLGGMSYISGDYIQRGIYCYITPIELRHYDNNVTMESMLAFSGYKHLYKPLKRKSDKDIQIIFDQVNNEIENQSGIAWDMVSKIMIQNEL